MVALTVYKARGLRALNLRSRSVRSSLSRDNFFAFTSSPSAGSDVHLRLTTRRRLTTYKYDRCAKVHCLRLNRRSNARVKI